MKTFNRFFVLALLAFLSVPSAKAVETVTLFRADLDASVVQPKTDPDHDQSTATAVANFVLTYDPDNLAATTLAYDIQFDGLDIGPDPGTDLLDDVTAIHIHDTTACANAALCGDGNGGQLPGSTAGTRHVLNVFGVPRGGDDDDMQAFADTERVTGLWDPTDANNEMMAPSFSIADPAILDLLFAGKLAVMTHTNLVGSGEIGGFIVQVPEPGTATLVMLAFGALAIRRR